MSHVHPCKWLLLPPLLQVLLDGVVRKLDRRRRVLLWRIAAMEGASSDDKVCVCVCICVCACVYVCVCVCAHGVMCMHVQSARAGRQGQQGSWWRVAVRLVG